MSAISVQKTDFITDCRTVASYILELESRLDLLRTKWDGRDYSTNLIDPDDFIGENEDITKTDVTNCISTLKDSVNSLVTTHKTTLTKLSNDVVLGT